MFFLTGKYIPMYKSLLYSQHANSVLKKQDLGKGETALMEGLRALTHSGLSVSQTSPILRYHAGNTHRPMQSQPQPTVGSVKFESYLVATCGLIAG